MNGRAMVAGLVLLSLVATACTAPAPPRSQASSPPSTACAAPQGTSEPETATTIDVVQQAYSCILDNYYGAPALDHRSLLVAGFGALTRELDRQGLDGPEATMPALSGDRKSDWAAFEAVFLKTTDRVPRLREELAVVILEAIVAELGDNHVRWTGRLEQPPTYHDGDGYGLGLLANVDRQQASTNPGVAVAPLFVTEVRGGAARASGLRPGDIIESVNGSAPFIDDKATAAILALYPEYPEARPVELRLLRQSTGRRWTVTLRPDVYRQDLTALQMVTSKTLNDDIAYVKVRGFTQDSAKRAIDAIARLRADRKISGVVLDMRGNGGGSTVEAARLVSAFVHDKVTGYLCTVDDQCQPTRTDDTVELIDLPLAVLTDRGCASACEHFSANMKNLKIGPLVGTRTAGMVSGPAQPYLLSNNTTLVLPSKHGLGRNHEVIDRIGVAPDHHVPLTAKDAAAGRDPALTKALALLDN